MYNSFTFYRKYYILILELGGVNIKNSFNDFFDYIDNVNNENELKAPKKTNKTLVLVINLLSISLLVGGGYGVKYILDQQRDIREAEEKRQELLLSQQRQADALKEQLEKERLEKERLEKEAEEERNKKNINRDFDDLKKRNPDTVAWLYVPGTEIDMPIVQSDDNSYYLTHNFDREYNSMGWAFADSKNSFPELSQNTIMYGHTYKSTTIFSNLKNVLNDSWLNDEDKHIITFDTEKERYKFKVFSVYTIDETTDYLYISFGSDKKYQKYLDRETKRSIKDFDVDTSTEDKILTLSTCYITEHQRLIVHAKLISSE